MRYEKMKDFPFVTDPELIPPEDIVDVGNGFLLQQVVENGFVASIFQAYDDNEKLKNEYLYLVYPDDDSEEVDIEGAAESRLLGEVEIENGDKKAAWTKTVNTINERFKTMCKAIEEAYLAVTSKKVS